MSGNTRSAFPIAPRCRHNREVRYWKVTGAGVRRRRMDTLEACGDAGLAKTYLERARELKPMLAAASDETERGREVTPEVVEAMKERGIFRMLLPRSIGGAELDPLTYTEVLYTLA